MTEPRDDSADGVDYPPAPAPAPEPYTADDAPDGPPPWFAGHRPPEPDRAWAPTAPLAPVEPPTTQPAAPHEPATPTAPEDPATTQQPAPRATEPEPAPQPSPAAPVFPWMTPSSTSPTQSTHTGHAATGYAAATGYPPSAPPSDYAPGGQAAAPQDWTSWADVRGATGEAAEAEPAPTSGRRRGRRRRQPRTVALAVVVLLVLLALLAGMVAGAIGGRYVFPTGAGTLPTSSSTTAPPDRAPESVAGIAAAALESTVFIQVLGRSSASSGSGMVLREDGYIVTNNHVIAAAAGDNGRVRVTFADGVEEAAQIVGRTVEYDLAVLRVEREGLVPLVLADSANVVVGDPAVAVGAPLGLEGTVTTGIISALNRPVQAGGSSDGAASFINAIQTDAAINPGNSGGPLLNLDGEVVGINTAIAQASGRETGSIGLGFAIPADQVRRTAEQIIAEGRATYPVIGVALDTQHQGEGVQVLTQDTDTTEAVTTGGPSDLAGIQAGDVITRVDGAPVTSPSELIVAVRARAPGETITLSVRRDGTEREVDVVLGEEVSD